MSDFREGQQTWIERLGDLRNTVRQEVIGRHLDEHVAPGSRALDVGCGQGTQAIRLARRDCAVLGVDPSPELLARLAADAAAAGVDAETRQGRLEDLETLLGERSFDVVCAHGLLMYVDDPMLALERLAVRVAAGGRLSITFRNAAALAFRPGVRGQWQAASDAFDADSYVNELGVQARAQHLHEVTTVLEDRGLEVEAWYGVRIFTDPLPAETPVPGNDGLDLLLEAEQKASARDPYRHLGSQIHVIAQRPGWTMVW